MKNKLLHFIYAFAFVTKMARLEARSFAARKRAEFHYKDIRYSQYFIVECHTTETLFDILKFEKTYNISLSDIVVFAKRFNRLPRHLEATYIPHIGVEAVMQAVQEQQNSITLKQAV